MYVLVNQWFGPKICHVCPLLLVVSCNLKTGMSIRMSKTINEVTQERLCITKTKLYNFDPLKPQFYIVKLGLQGYTLFFFSLLKNIDCGYSLELPQRGGSNECPQSIF